MNVTNSLASHFRTFALCCSLLFLSGCGDKEKITPQDTTDPAPATDSAPPTTDSAPPATDFAPPTTDSAPPATDSAPPATQEKSYLQPVLVSETQQWIRGAGSPPVPVPLLSDIESKMKSISTINKLKLNSIRIIYTCKGAGRNEGLFTKLEFNLWERYQGSVPFLQTRKSICLVIKQYPNGEKENTYKFSDTDYSYCRNDLSKTISSLKTTGYHCEVLRLFTITKDNHVVSRLR